MLVDEAKPSRKCNTHTMKILRISLGVLSALVLVLVVHIYMATHKAPVHNEGIQLARIDMLQPIDSTQAMEIRSHVKQMAGVKNCYVNVPAGTVVYAYDLRQQTSAVVYASVASFSPVPCQQFTPSAKELATGCPAMDHDSFSYRFSNWIRSI